MVPEGKTHELGMLKIEKMHILSWKEEGVLSENAKWLRRQRLSSTAWWLRLRTSPSSSRPCAKKSLVLIGNGKNPDR
jgi:hypothetical protein